MLASSDPRAVLGVILLSRASYRKMVQNLAWGAGYNLAAIPLAAGVFEFAGLTLSPAVGAILMSASTVVVAFNAQLLRRLDLRLDREEDPEQKRSSREKPERLRRLPAVLVRVDDRVDREHQRRSHRHRAGDVEPAGPRAGRPGQETQRAGWLPESPSRFRSNSYCISSPWQLRHPTVNLIGHYRQVDFQGLSF